MPLSWSGSRIRHSASRTSKGVARGGYARIDTPVETSYSVSTTRVLILGEHLGHIRMIDRALERGASRG